MREDIIKLLYKYKSQMCGVIGSETHAHRMYTMNLIVVIFFGTLTSILELNIDHDFSQC